MGRHATRMLAALEEVLRDHIDGADVSEGDYDDLMDLTPVLDAIHRAGAIQLGSPRAEQARVLIDEMSRKIVRALVWDLAEERGSHLNVVRTHDDAPGSGPGASRS